MAKRSIKIQKQKQKQNKVQGDLGSNSAERTARDGSELLRNITAQKGKHLLQPKETLDETVLPNKHPSWPSEPGSPCLEWAVRCYPQRIRRAL